MSVYKEVYGSHGERPYSYNGLFEYGSNRFSVNVTSFSYSTTLRTKGGSSGRQRQVVYPVRVEQSDLNVELIFRDPEEYHAFGEFIRQYHLTSTSSTIAPMMWFKSPAIGSGVNYGVAVDQVPMSFTNNMPPAPTMTLRLKILRDMIDTSEVSASKMTGNMQWLVDKNTAAEILEAINKDDSFKTPEQEAIDKVMGAMGSILGGIATNKAEDKNHANRHDTSKNQSWGTANYYGDVNALRDAANVYH